MWIIIQWISVHFGSSENIQLLDILLLLDICLRRPFMQPSHCDVQEMIQGKGLFLLSHYCNKHLLGKKKPIWSEVN